MSLPPCCRFHPAEVRWPYRSDFGYPCCLRPTDAGSASFRDFAERLARGDIAGVQVITDGSDPNTAYLVSGYVQGAWLSWLAQRAVGNDSRERGQITVEPRFWFNPERPH